MRTGKPLSVCTHFFVSTGMFCEWNETYGTISGWGVKADTFTISRLEVEVVLGWSGRARLRGRYQVRPWPGEGVSSLRVCGKNGVARDLANATTLRQKPALCVLGPTRRVTTRMMHRTVRGDDRLMS